MPVEHTVIEDIEMAQSRALRIAGGARGELDIRGILKIDCALSLVELLCIGVRINFFKIFEV